MVNVTSIFLGLLITLKDTNVWSRLGVQCRSLVRFELLKKEGAYDLGICEESDVAGA